MFLILFNNKGFVVQLKVNYVIFFAIYGINSLSSQIVV